MTKRDCFIEKDVMMNCVLWLGSDWDGTLCNLNAYNTYANRVCLCYVCV